MWLKKMMMMVERVWLKEMMMMIERVYQTNSLLPVAVVAIFNQGAVLLEGRAL